MTTIALTVDGVDVDFTLQRITPYTTNRSLPLVCGHRHATGHLVWVAGDLAVCSRCAESGEVSTR